MTSHRVRHLHSLFDLTQERAAEQVQKLSLLSHRKISLTLTFLLKRPDE